MENENQTTTPEGLGAMIASGHPEALQLYMAMKPKLPLWRLEQIEGGVLGRIVNDSTVEGKLDAHVMSLCLDMLSPEIKHELWGDDAAALESFSQCGWAISALQECAAHASEHKFSQAGLESSLLLGPDGLRLTAAGGALVSWRFLTNADVVKRLTNIALRSEKAARATRRVDVIRALQQNQKDVQVIVEVLSRIHTSQQMSLAKN